MGGLCEETSEKGSGGGKMKRKGQQQGPMEAITKVVYFAVTNRPASPLHKGNKRKNNQSICLSTATHFTCRFQSIIFVSLSFSLQIELERSFFVSHKCIWSVSISSSMPFDYFLSRHSLTLFLFAAMPVHVMFSHVFVPLIRSSSFLPSH